MSGFTKLAPVGFPNVGHFQANKALLRFHDITQTARLQNMPRVGTWYCCTSKPLCNPQPPNLGTVGWISKHPDWT
jgi:hypothetical protein